MRAAAWQNLGMAATTGGESIAPGFARFWWAEAVSGFGTAITLHLNPAQVYVFDSAGAWKPVAGGTDKNGLSVGLGFTAVKATF